MNEAKYDPMPPVSLAVLGGPKPTTARFYLHTVSGYPLGEKYNEMACLYKKGQNELRGRKFYRHHGAANPAEYTRKDAASRNDDQNRTVDGALNAGTEFRFKLIFENTRPFCRFVAVSRIINVFMKRFLTFWLGVRVLY